MPKSKELIEHILVDIQNEIKDIRKVELAEIRQHSKETNGRITRLELWRARIAGSLAIIIMLLVPVVIQYISKVVVAYFE